MKVEHLPTKLNKKKTFFSTLVPSSLIFPRTPRDVFAG